MSRCEHTVTCPFFTAGVGYSPGLFEAMRDTYCLGDSGECARLLAIELVGRERVPLDLLPSDTDRLGQIRERETEADASE